MPADRTARREGAGVGPYLTTTRKGMRCSSAVAFLWPAMRRPNLTVVTGAHVERIGFDGRRADSVGDAGAAGVPTGRGSGTGARDGMEGVACSGTGANAPPDTNASRSSAIPPSLVSSRLSLSLTHTRARAGCPCLDTLFFSFVWTKV